MYLGTAFQIIDDVLDYSARQQDLGKTVGDDFREGKITLPVILAYRRGSEEDRVFWRRTLEDLEQKPDDLARAVAAQRLRDAGTPTLPTTIGLELEINPFLRAENAGVQKAVGLVGKPAAAWFGSVVVL